MHVSARPYSVPKAGSSEDEYEDAFWPTCAIECGGLSFSFAVADGATEASYSKVWAQILVEAYCKGYLNNDDFRESLSDLQLKWNESRNTQALPWYTEEKVREGAFSSLLGLTVREILRPEGVERIWEATAVGDCCLFQVRDDEFISSFPLTHSEQFNSRPMLISTNDLFNKNLPDYVFNGYGNWEVEDTFYLMTDALACWFLREAEEGRQPWKIRRSAPEDFEIWIRRLRKDRALRNDDVTLIRIELLSDIE